MQAAALVLRPARRRPRAASRRSLRCRDLDARRGESPAERRFRSPPASRRRASRAASAPGARTDGRSAPSASTCRTRARGRSREPVAHDVRERLARKLDAQGVRRAPRASERSRRAFRAKPFLRRSRRVDWRARDPGGRGLGRCVDYEECDAAWRDEDLRRLEPQMLRRDELAELRLGLVARLGRQLLAPDLNQQARHRASPGRGFATFSVSLRARRM